MSNRWEARRHELQALGIDAVISRLFDAEERLASLQSGLPGWASIPAVENYRRFRAREGIGASRIATISRPEHCAWLVSRLQRDFPRLSEMSVVEIGAGLGYLAVALARLSRQLVAIEADPLFSQLFVERLYAEKPTNLTWIFGTATEEMASWVPKADLVLVVTGSDEVHLRRLGSAFLAEGGALVMPWQDWNEGRAVIDAAPDFVPLIERQTP